MRRSWPAVSLLMLAGVSAGCKQEGSITVHSIRFDGVKAVDPARLESVLATRENTKVPLVGWELPWAKKNAFDRGRFEADLKRIEAFYADRGYPDARVTGFDVKLNDKQDKADVTVQITEGEPLRVAAVEFQGFDAMPPDHLEQVRKQMPLKPGEPRDRQEVVSTHELALNELRDHGYPYAKVATDEQPAGERQVTVTFTAEPGTLAYFGPIEIAGNSTVSDRVIRRQLTFRPGDLYRRSVVQDAQRRLYAMELFQFVNVETLSPEQQLPQVPVRVTVAEGKHQRVNLGVGYGTEEHARVDGEYTHVNFLGGARSGGVHARYSSLDRGVRLQFNQPYFFSPHFSFGAEGQQWHTVTPAYNSDVTNGKLSVLHRTSARTSWSVFGLMEKSSSEVTVDLDENPDLRDDLIALGLDPNNPIQSGTLGAIGFDFNHSTADNVLNARRGYQIAFHTEEAGKLLPGTFNYYASSIEGRHYIPVSQALVIANRLQLGTLNAVDNDQANVPFSKKYFLGGASSVRGWGRYEISPLSGGEPVGGNSLFAFSSELRARVIGKLGGVLFLDGGNVWADDWNFDFTDLKYAAGIGLRYQTPIGPIRFDFGHQLNRIEGLLIDGEPETRHWRIHFSIGQAF